MIKRDYFSFFAFFLVASLTLTACDSNEADDTVAVTEEPQVVEETRTVSAGEPIVEQIATAVSTELASVVGENIVVDTSAGAIIQTTTTAEPVSGQSAAPAVVTTIAPLVNQATGQPIAAAAVVSQIAGQTQTVIATANTSNPASIQMSAAQSSGAATSSSTTSLNSGFDPVALTTTASSSAAQTFVTRRRTLLQGGQTFAWRSRADGSTWASTIQSDLATGKRRNLTLTLASFQDSMYNRWYSLFSSGVQQCALQNSATASVSLTYSTGPGTTASATFDCAGLSLNAVSAYPPAQ